MHDYEQWETANTETQKTEKSEKAISEKSLSEKGSQKAPSIEMNREAEKVPETEGEILAGILTEDIMKETPGKQLEEREMEEPRTPQDNFDISRIEDQQEEQQPQKKRKLTHKGKLLIDSVISISKNELKKQEKDTEDIVRERKTVPKTKQDLLKVTNFSQMISLPNIQSLPFEFIEIYEKKEMRKDLGSVERERRIDEVDDVGITVQFNEPSPVHERTEEPIHQETLLSEERTPLKGIEVTPLKTPKTPKEQKEKKEKTPKKKKELTSEEKEKRKREKEEKEVLSKQYKGLGVTSNTLKVISLFKQNFRDQDELSVKNMLKGRSKKVASQYFFECLVLKSKDIIQVEQNEPFGDILITKTEKFV